MIGDERRLAASVLTIVGTLDRDATIVEGTRGLLDQRATATAEQRLEPGYRLVDRLRRVLPPEHERRRHGGGSTAPMLTPSRVARHAVMRERPSRSGDALRANRPAGGAHAAVATTPTRRTCATSDRSLSAAGQ
jgi:hypothetical protein